MWEVFVLFLQLFCVNLKLCQNKVTQKKATTVTKKLLNSAAFCSMLQAFVKPAFQKTQICWLEIDTCDLEMVRSNKFRGGSKPWKLWMSSYVNCIVYQKGYIQPKNSLEMQFQKYSTS